MKYFSEQIKINKGDNGDNTCIHFEFNGHFTQQASEESTRIWCAELESNPAKKYNFIWDCTHMTGFEPGARREWYNGLSTHKASISKVTVIANHIIIRAAAKVMLSFFGIPAEINRS